MRMIRRLLILSGLFLHAAGMLSAAEDRDARVRNDRTDVQATGLWIYNDLAKGIEAAARTGKPLLVVFRCVP